jgi:hypothetical protein
MAVSELIEQLQKLPPDLKVGAEGSDCVNDVRAAGVYEVRGPAGVERSCILVCEPDFYGILGPGMRERTRRRFNEDLVRRGGRLAKGEER